MHSTNVSQPTGSLPPVGKSPTSSWKIDNRSSSRQLPARLDFGHSFTSLQTASSIAAASDKVGASMNANARIPKIAITVAIRFAVNASLVYICVGCSSEDGIQQYSVLKPEFVPKGSATPPVSPVVAGPLQPGRAAETSASKRPERLLAAIVREGQQAWFFKMTGPPLAMADLGPTFKTFAASIQFGPNGEPTWTLPAGWSATGRSGMRFATISTGPSVGASSLEVSVIGLPVTDDPWEDQLLANLNRWRSQLSLSPATTAEETIKETLSLAGGQSLVLVDLEGMGSPTTRPAPPAIPGRGPAADAAPAVTKLSYTKPPQWSEGRRTSFRKAAFEMVNGNDKIEVTVIDLPGGSGTTIDNVNRWRGQIGLSPVTEVELQLETIPAGELSAKYVKLLNPSAEGGGQAILGAIIDRNEVTWFVKLQGNERLATEQEEALKQFVASLKGI
jgi:hypothetical protein